MSLLTEHQGAVHLKLKPERTLRQKEIRSGYLFITPWIIGFLLFTVGPMLFSLFLSFTDYSILSNTDARWVGSQNYTDILSLEVKTLSNANQKSADVLDRGYSELWHVGNVVLGATDPDFWIAMRVTASFAVIALPMGMILSLALALLLNTKVRGIRIFRTLIYSPAIVPGVATAIIFQQLLGKDQGWLNLLLRIFGITGPDWLHRAEWLIPGLVVIGLWTLGGGMLIYLAGLQSIPTELYEASRVDGANLWVQFRRITLPLLTPIFLYDLILGLIATFQYFSTPYLLTGGLGGASKAAFFFNLYLYKEAWGYGRMGYASALAWLLFMLVMLLTAVVFRTSGRWVFYAGAKKG